MAAEAAGTAAGGGGGGAVGSAGLAEVEGAQSNTLSGGDTLFISEGSARLVRVHPAVLFSILDHFIRRKEGQMRVIGTLLGYIEDSHVEVTNCFAVPHSDIKEEVAVGQENHRAMWALHQRVNPKEKIVGWYATSMEGVSIVDSSSLVHNFYANECVDPVHLVVDTAMRGDTVSVKAYVSSPLMVAGIDLANMFHQVKVELAASEPERICIDRMIKGQSQPFSTSEAFSDVSQELQGLETSMERLLDMVETASSYVNKVIAGEVEADDETGRRIADTLASVPRIRPEVFDQVFNDTVQDLLMVSYLASLTNTQLAISERLNAAM